MFRIIMECLRKIKCSIGLLYFNMLTLIFNYRNRREKTVSFETKLYSENINNIKYQKFILKPWSKNYSHIEKKFINNDVRFLQDRIIKNTMFLSTGGKWQNTQIKYLESKMNEEKLKELLRENCVGYPTITSFKYNSSHNLIHHLYHLVKFQSETGCDIDSLSTVVEFGGGYGSMCRLIKRLNFTSTYVIIDLPIFSFIQLYYLKNVYGAGEVNIILSDKDKIMPNKINLIPIDESLLDKIKTIEPDLFIATWSLSEANKYTQEYIYANDFFNSMYVLIAHQKKSTQFEHAESIKLTRKYKVVYNAETEYIPENYYLFGKRIGI